MLSNECIIEPEKSINRIMWRPPLAERGNKNVEEKKLRKIYDNRGTVGSVRNKRKVTK